ncbi:hypothetical protein DFR24_0547 [Panacagrimonas perspica]|uniref:Uncharacterized protein n=1 Tax=Panacagrimonas perspica TaxID=381431 RepID=A0A4S3JZN3_9GAMM|nr:hypothetical protein [Panacagrimonas perspica]TDU31188.1 hypothetical protein DFR24_0547 [Panacagrimonas perspica]THD01060.1 hypothetical protein B1810_21805 [Panacagrimonas perspica]
MTSANEVNRELTRLDEKLRSGAIDRAGFRAVRRKLLLDFEERQTTTTPGALTGHEVTILDAPEELPLPEQAPLARPAAGAGNTTRRPSAVVLAASAIGVLVVLAIAAWWMFFRPATPSTRPNPTAAAAMAAAPVAGAETPLTVASDLLSTEWTDGDVATFLQRWTQLPPAAVDAVSEDSRIWLLRGETDRRLRDAREAESVEQSVDLQARVQRLEQVQAAIRSR